MSGYKKKRSGGILETSMLIHYLTKFFEFVYRTFLAGILGWLFTSYEIFADAFSSSVLVRKIKALSNYRIFHLARRIKRYVALTYERSFFLSHIRDLSMRFLTAKLNMFGLFFFLPGSSGAQL